MSMAHRLPKAIDVDAVGVVGVIEGVWAAGTQAEPAKVDRSHGLPKAIDKVIVLQRLEPIEHGQELAEEIPAQASLIMAGKAEVQCKAQRRRGGETSRA